MEEVTMARIEKAVAAADEELSTRHRDLMYLDVLRRLEKLTETVVSIAELQGRLHPVPINPQAVASS